MEQIHLIDPLAAGEEDRRQLVRLWQECFEADEPYLQVYREQMLAKSGARTAVLREEGKILGMLTLLPCSYRVGERQLPSMYLFA
ncbi:MAG: GNAT family N-acetyltransferase, partial [Negativibacillus sp.]